MILIDFLCCKYLCIFSVFIYALCMRQYFWRNCFELRFNFDVVVMIIWSIVVIINSVLTLQVLTASLPHDREPFEIKVVSNHTCSLHTCVCAGSRRVRVRLSGFRRQGISSTPGGFLKCPIPVRVCAEQLWYFESKFWFRSYKDLDFTCLVVFFRGAHLPNLRSKKIFFMKTLSKLGALMV